jgi:predicted nucleic acid-binding protein
MSMLLDTNVVSELMRPRPDVDVLRWFSDLKMVAISAVTVDEIYFGLALKSNSRIENLFGSFLDEACSVLDVTRAIARHAGQLRGRFAAQGRTRSQSDMLIAATAAHHSAPLATRNVRDFASCGIALVNPFE